MYKGKSALDVNSSTCIENKTAQWTRPSRGWQEILSQGASYVTSHAISRVGAQGW